MEIASDLGVEYAAIKIIKGGYVIYIHSNVFA